MRIANKHVQLWVTDGQHAYMKAKAKGYGITLTRLVLLAVEVYARTYDEVPEGSSLVVVKYGTASRRVQLWVTDRQHAYMKAKAKEYKITLARLMFLAVGAYTRTYDEIPEESSLVAVNYATWYKMDFRLQVIRRDLEDTKRQLAAIRAAARRGQDEKTTKAVDECAKEMARIAADVALCKDVLNRVAEMPLIADPYVGPLEDASPQEDVPQGDDDEGL